MKGMSWSVLCALIALLLHLSSAAKPMGGKFRLEQDLSSGASSADGDKSGNKAVCASLTLYDGGDIHLHLKGTIKDKTKARVFIVVSVMRSKCANIRRCDSVPEMTNYIKNETSFSYLYTFTGTVTQHDMIVNHIKSPDAKPAIAAGGDESTDESTDVNTDSNTERSTDESEGEGNTTNSEDKSQVKGGADGGNGGNKGADGGNGGNKGADGGKGGNKGADGGNGGNKGAGGGKGGNKGADGGKGGNKGADGGKGGNKGADGGKGGNKGADGGKGGDKDPENNDTEPQLKIVPPNNKPKVYTNGSSSGLYIVYIESYILDHSKGAVEVNLTFHLDMKNYYGYLSAIDYPALVFYGMMTAVYAILGIVWCVAMCCSYKDLVRLQFWVFAVIILGFLEKIFFVSEYSSVNVGGEASYLIPLAEVISAVKRGLARVLLIIVSLGFGTVKPRLGDSLGKVVAVGVIYCIFALIDGIVRAKAETYDTQDTSQIVTLALLFIMDSIIFYWAFTSLVAVRRALRLRKNYVKLSMYNHFAYTLIFSIIAALAFTIWVFVEVNFPEGGCLKDWKEVWLRDCFWHFLFCFILIVIMIIWRPSANKNRFAYSLVNDLEQDEEEEEIENKNFETVKMRTVSRGGGTPPPVSTQVEDDMKWVEENLPTTAMDRALPLILDSDEEVMNTKFEASKMN